MKGEAIHPTQFNLVSDVRIDTFMLVYDPNKDSVVTVVGIPDNVNADELSGIIETVFGNAVLEASVIVFPEADASSE
jgi:hypothetical protein